MFKRQLIALFLALCLICPAFAESDGAAEPTETDDPQAQIEALTAQVAELQATIDALEARLAVYEEPESEYPPDSEVITFDGGSVPLSQAQAVYADRAAYYELMEIDEAEYADDLKADVLANLAEDAVLAVKAQELGVYDLTEEDRADAAAEAEEIYEANVEYFLPYFYDETLTEEEIRQQTEAYLASEGVSYDDILEENLSNIWKQRLFDEVTRDVTVSEEDIRAMYDDGLSTAMATYTEDPEMFEYDYAYGDIIYYRPEGYRQIEYLQLPFPMEESIQASDLINEISVTDEDGQFVLQAELDALYDGLTERYADVITRSQTEELSALAQEFAISEFYALPVSADSATVDSDFCAAAMELEPGETSEPIRNDGGLWILRYVEDVVPGEVSYEELYDELSASALDAARQDMYFELIDQWIDDANIVTHPEML